MKVSELFEANDKRLKFTDLKAWKAGAKKVGATIELLMKRRWVATGYDGTCGEFDIVENEGWIVPRWAKKDLKDVVDLNEDWGSSDWHPVMRAMDTYIEQGYSIEEAASRCADRWYQDMGWEEAEQAEPNIVARYKRLQGLNKKQTFEAHAGKGMWVIKNKDGVEKRFKDDESPEAKAWKASSSPKKASNVKLAVYSDAYWAKKEDDARDKDDYEFVTPWKTIKNDFAATDKINKVVEDQFNTDKIDWTLGKASEIKREGTTCAAIVVRVSYEYGPEDDMGFDDVRGDTQNILVARNPKKPSQIDFVQFT